MDDCIALAPQVSYRMRAHTEVHYHSQNDKEPIYVSAPGQKI